MNNNYNIEIEQIILGECISSGENLLTLLNNGVTLDEFYSTEHKTIYEGMISTLSKHNTIDIGILTIELKGKVPPSHLTNIFEGSIQSKVTNLKAHINILLKLSKKRKYNKLAEDIQNSDYEDLDNIIKERIKQIEESSVILSNTSGITTLDEIETTDIYNTAKIKTGLMDIDNKILGFVTGSLVVITGYSGNGKSTLINQMCIAESISQGHKVFAYSPELTGSNFKDWLYSTVANNKDFIEINENARSYKKLTTEGKKSIDKWIKEKLYVYKDDKITFSGEQLLKDMDRLAKEKNVKVFVIDNLMKIELEGGYKNEFIAQKTFINKLKEFARKYEAVVHLVAHLKKPQEKNEKVSKFNVSGSIDITNIADYVISVSRVDNAARKKEPNLRDTVVKIMKDRPTGNEEIHVNLYFNKERKRFYAYDTELDRDYGYSNIKDDCYMIGA